MSSVLLLLLLLLFVCLFVCLFEENNQEGSKLWQLEPT